MTERYHGITNEKLLDKKFKENPKCCNCKWLYISSGDTLRDFSEYDWWDCGYKIDGLWDLESLGRFRFAEDIGLSLHCPRARESLKFIIEKEV